jgi:phosphoribosylamine---glycine ligase
MLHLNILLVGSGAREHAIARAIKRSSHDTTLVCYGTHINPGIEPLCDAYDVGTITDPAAVRDYAREHDAQFVIIGPEAPLGAGVVDELVAINIPCIGPKKSLARIETSKRFARDLMKKHGINACPRYEFFSKMTGVARFLADIGDGYVIKCDGLMGGKGVRVSGDHIANRHEGYAWCRELISRGKTFLLEEKLIGQEFSLISFSDGRHMAHTIPVQDHKRAGAGDTGPNTGGMGSYSDATHVLPFLTQKDVDDAQQINERVMQALNKECGQPYKGILYGGFIATKDGVKVIEYNARFGDPEAMNILSLLSTDFVDICLAIIYGKLSQDIVRFEPRASVCKYAVPDGYPNDPVKHKKIDISEVADQSLLYVGAVEERDSELYQIGSRAVAVVSTAATTALAEQQVENDIQRIKGPLYHRSDIGTHALIQQRIDFMQALRSGL